MAQFESLVATLSGTSVVLTWNYHDVPLSAAQPVFNRSENGGAGGFDAGTSPSFTNVKVYKVPFGKAPIVSGDGTTLVTTITDGTVLTYTDAVAAGSYEYWLVATATVQGVSQTFVSNTAAISNQATTGVVTATSTQAADSDQANGTVVTVSFTYTGAGDFLSAFLQSSLDGGTTWRHVDETDEFAFEQVGGSFPSGTAIKYRVLVNFPPEAKPVVSTSNVLSLTL